MSDLKILLAALVCIFTCTGAALAQDTNYLRTQIGLFEARGGTVLIKGSNPLGSIPLGSAELSVRCKETSDAGSGEKIYGLAFDLEEGQLTGDRILVDDDEVEPLLNAVGYIMKINYDVTTLPTFEASFTTKAGLRVLAHSDRKEGGVRFYIQFEEAARLPISSVQMGQLYSLIQTGQKNLTALKSSK